MAQGKGYSGVLAVPAAWNYQTPELYEYMGDVWYAREFSLPWNAADCDVLLDIDAANWNACVYVNGTDIGGHSGGYQSFELDVTPHVHRNAPNTLAIRCDMKLSRDTLLQDGRGIGHWHNRGAKFPPSSGDHFPFGGIIRPVRLLLAPRERITGFAYRTELKRGGEAVMHYEVLRSGDGKVALEIDGRKFEGEKGAVEFSSPRFWAPGQPNLYDVCIRLYGGAGRLVDEYTDYVGMRDVTVGGGGVEINGKPVYLYGTSRHDDFPALGSGLSHALLRRDVELMRFLGMNVFRAGHYPPSWELAELCDRLGMMLIAEAPANALFHGEGRPEELASEALGRNHKRAVSEMIDTLENHPSVIMWSVANEPASQKSECAEYLQDVRLHAKDRDPGRPVIFTSCVDEADKASGYFDLTALNIYHHSSAYGGDVEQVKQRVGTLIDEMHRRHGKPVLVTEFGAEGIAGFHSLPPVMFTEDDAVEHNTAYLDVIESREFAAGAMLWAFADFLVGEHYGRAMMNHKGIFTRERQPKRLAWELKKRLGMSADAGRTR